MRKALPGTTGPRLNDGQRLQRFGPGGSRHAQARAALPSRAALELPMGDENEAGAVDLRSWGIRNMDACNS